VLLSLRSLSVERGGKSLLKNISIEFTPGRLHYLIGLNGSGKTTLLKCLAGAMDFSGDIRLEDKPLTSYASKERARKVAWVPQHLIPFSHLTTREFVLTGRFPYLGFLGSYSSHDHEVCLGFLEQLALLDFADRALNTLSGGELQRATLARALAQETPILLLDEPDQSLDPPAREDLFQRLEGLSQSGKTLICTTHHMEALSYPHARILGIRAGELVWDHPGGESFTALKSAVYGS